MSKNSVCDTVEHVNEFIERIVGRIKLDSRIISERIRDSSKELYILYADYRSSPALSLYLLLRSLSIGRCVCLNRLESYSLYIAPYNEGREPDLIIISSREGFNRLMRSLPPLKLTGHRGVIISSGDLNEIRSYTGDSFDSLSVDEEFFSLEASILLLYSGLEALRRDRSSPRISRLYNEIMNLRDVAKDLCRRYEKDLIGIREILLKPFSRVDVILTPSSMIVGEELITMYVQNSLNSEISIADYDRPVIIRGDSHMILFYSEIEQQMISEIRKKILFNRQSFHEVVLKTDPLISPIYFGILLQFLKHLMKIQI